MFDVPSCILAGICFDKDEKASSKGGYWLNLLSELETCDHLKDQTITMIII